VEGSDFGRYLVQQRELRGLSVEEVASSTKIPLALVRALEEGRFEKLPGRVFVVNFIRSYARVIGLEPEDAVLRFEELHAPPTDSVQPVEPPRTLGGRKGRSFALVVVVVALVLTAVGVVVWKLHGLRHGHR
jgi:cytoskeletal protein RodZ